jgi:DNA-binding response OmpR family regulator
MPGPFPLPDPLSITEGETRRATGFAGAGRAYRRGMRARVLVVDDEPTIAEIVCRYLQRAGYDASSAGDGPSAVEAATSAPPDLIVLDLMLPGIDGLEVMRRIRGRLRPAPAIILLTARGEETDRIVGLNLGADDYVVKPFSPRELVARADAVLRRATPAVATEPDIAIGGLTIEVGARRVTFADSGEDAHLTQREFDLLLFLARHPGRAFSREELMERVWGHAFFTDTATVTVHIRRLRAKLAPAGDAAQLIETVWGVGYRLAAPA